MILFDHFDSPAVYKFLRMETHRNHKECHIGTVGSFTYQEPTKTI